MEYRHPEGEYDIERIIEVDRIANGLINNFHYRRADYGHILMAISGESCIGSVAFPVIGNCCNIDSIGVLPQNRMNGVGRKMLEIVREQSLKENVRKLWTSTTEPGFFGSCGFKSISPVRGPWYSMKLDL
jgi:N-acetylglutamate synthase-like GNAT family acetyltransferase